MNNTFRLFTEISFQLDYNFPIFVKLCDKLYQVKIHFMRDLDHTVVWSVFTIPTRELG